MDPDIDSDFTKLLNRLGQEDQTAPEEFLSLVHGHLRRLAAFQAPVGSRDATLQPTALVHEAWMKLAPPGSERSFNDRRHFFRVAVRAMRSILIDHARAQAAEKRGSGKRPLSLDESLCVGSEEAEQMLELDLALEKLERVDPDLFELVQLRFFGGLSHEDIAAHLELSTRTVERRWKTARLWLMDSLQGSERT